MQSGVGSIEARSIGVLDLLHSYPTLFRPLFAASDKPKLTADRVSSTFIVQWSPRGCNQREAEEAVIFGWMEYLDGVKGIGVSNMHDYALP